MGGITKSLTTEKAQNFGGNTQTITSMEVAEMVGKAHNELLKDIRRYYEQLGQGKIPQSDFFTESTYQNSQNKTMPCYNVTKKGCEFIAHKMTGVKGTEFTARYINRFHEMESIITQPNNNFFFGLQAVKFIADDLRVAESSRLFMYENYCKDIGIPTGFIPKYEDNGNRERCSLTELLKRNGCSLSVQKFNQRLINAGYLEIKERASKSKGVKRYKSLTDKGLKYGVNLICDKNQKETQPYYYADNFMELYYVIAP